MLLIKDKLEDENSLELKPPPARNPTRHLSEGEDLGLKDDEREAAGPGLESLEMVAIGDKKEQKGSGGEQSGGVGGLVKQGRKLIF